MCKVLLNEELNGVELYFEGKPAKEILEDIKRVGYRWNGKKICWYAKQNEKTLDKAKKYSNVEINSAVIKPINKVQKYDLFEATTYVEVNREKMSTKDIAKEVRKELKSRFNFVKFSVTSDYDHVRCEIKSSPFEKDSKYLKAIMEYTNKLIKNYEHCTCYDPYGDYGSRYNFYFFGTSIDYDYIQTESNDSLKEICNTYDVKEAEALEMQRQKEEEEFKKYCEEQEIKKAEYEKREIIRKQNIKSIEKNIKVVDLEEKDKYFILNSKYANLNKNNTINEYNEEIAENDYNLENTKIEKEIYFNNENDFNNFSNMLLSDFSFLNGTGGSYTDDLRINSMQDYDNMNQNERDSVEWLRKGVAVYYNDKLMFVIDAQGYSYARYVGLVDENTTTTKTYECNQSITYEEVENNAIKANGINNIVKSTIEENNIKEQDYISYNTRKNISDMITKNHIQINKSIIQQIKDEKIKCMLYNCINNTDSIQDQFKNINIIDKDITIIRESMLSGANIIKIHVDNVIVEDTGIIKIIGKIPSKKGTYQTTIDNRNKVIIYDRFVDVNPEILFNINGNTVSTKYGSYDEQALIDILDYYNNTFIPIVNNVKPLFK